MNLIQWEVWKNDNEFIQHIYTTSKPEAEQIAYLLGGFLSENPITGVFVPQN